ncbi:MAG: SPOR domain-containing protein [Deltaproteobacteria bacterium]|nr:MAG: SPOR domain-containing protein [Deltaproteobacteria bacterium]
MFDQESEEKTQEGKNLFEQLIEDDFFKPADDDISPPEKDQNVEEAKPRAKSFLEEEAPVELFEEDSKKLIPDEEIPVRAYSGRKERKGIDRNKIALVGGGSLVVLFCLITFGTKYLGAGEGQGLVELPGEQHLIKPHASTELVVPTPLPKKADVKPTAPQTVAARTVSQQVPEFTLEVGRYSKDELASSQKKLIRLGLSTSTVRENKTTEVKYVTIDQKFNKDQARAASIKLDFVGGVKNRIVNQKEGTFTVQSGPFSSMGKAVEAKNKISQLGFAARIDFRSATSTVYRLRAGEFVTRSDTEKTSELLRQNGFAPKVIKL